LVELTNGVGLRHGLKIHHAALRSRACGEMLLKQWVDRILQRSVFGILTQCMRRYLGILLDFVGCKVLQLQV
jgi:hypothetical protein